MIVAALYDIHGNLPALDAVLEEIDILGVDRLVIGGDVAYGPFLRQTLERLMALGERVTWLRGNTDRELVACFDGDASLLPDDLRQAGEWEARQITSVHRDFLASLPFQQVLNVIGLGETLFCHASPRSDIESLTAATSPERLRRILANVTQKTVVCGHTHAQFDRSVDGVRVINAGSVGLPNDEPGAYWALLGPTVELQRTPYNRALTVSLIQASGHPLAETFVEMLEHPASAAEATTFFEEMALKKEREVLCSGR